MNSELKIKENKSPIIILHGWGLRGSVYRKLIELLKQKGHKVFAPDLPGFGHEPLLNNSMKLDDYILFVKNFIAEKKIKKPIIIGHSFGGRVTVKYAFLYPDEIDKLILTGVPIIRHVTFKKRLGYITAFLGGKIFMVFPESVQQFFRKVLYRSIGEWDYYKAGSLKEVFKNIINEDLVKYAKEIKNPVLLIWGSDDKIVPASDIKKLKIIIPKSKNIILQNASHKVPYLNALEFYKKIETFI